MGRHAQMETEPVRPLPWLEIVTSMALQRAVDPRHNYSLVNSPGQIGKLRLSVPLFANRFSLASSMQYMGSRRTVAQATLPSLFLSDITASTKRLPGNLGLQVGVRNLWGVKYSHPIALYVKYDTMPQPGRTFFVALTLRVGD
ncbi:MAG: hypothetical protein DMG57_09940 [Acidobacteria bacterium]|nr:MAG: hypothetical protein DMG57_09940 [Acidobacteriota bacterium]